MNLAIKDIDQLMRREISYKLLSECFDLPAPEWKSGGLIDGIVDALSALKSEAVNEGLKVQKVFNSRDDFEELQVAHAKLFVGPQKLLVPPYGSVYIDDGRRVMGDSTMSALNFYKKIGIKVSDRVKEMPDHIRVELEVMYYLLFKEQLALQEGNTADAEKYYSWQKEFFMNHLYPWVREFAYQLEQSSLHEFYTSMGIILGNFMEEESKYYEIHN